MSRKLLAIAPVIFAAMMMPAQANEPVHDSAIEIERIAERIDDPAMQDRASDSVEAMTDVMLDLPIGAFAEAIERARPGTVDRHIDRHTRLGDMVGPDADSLPRRIGNETRHAMSNMSSIMQAFAYMLPELQRIGEDMRAHVEEADNGE